METRHYFPFVKLQPVYPKKEKAVHFYKWATSIIDSLLLQGADETIISRHGLSPLDMAGYWDLAPTAKKVRAKGGTLYDLYGRNMALHNRRNHKEIKNIYHHSSEKENRSTSKHNYALSRYTNYLDLIRKVTHHFT